MVSILCAVAQTASLASAACDRCQRPQVVQFDLRVAPARPSDATDPDLASKILKWRDLFWTSGGVKSYLSNDDPSRECYTHLDGSFYTKGDTVGHSLTFGEEWSNLPPTTGPAGGDYLVTGLVDGANGSYTAKVELQVSKTREVVASASKSFSAADDPIAIGKQAASAAGPMLDKIRAFEKSKRASGDPYALGPTAELHPAKTTLKEGESVDVEVWLYDCDGDIASSPLANRPVRITATNGTVSTSSVTTGADGKAKFTFTAGDKPAEALLTAIHPYTLASEHTSASDPGYAALRIQETPSTLWKLQGSLITLRSYEETKRSNYSQIAEGGHSNQDIVETYRVGGVLRNIAKDSTTLFQSDVSPVDLRVEGFHRESELARGFQQLPQSWSRLQTFQTVSARPSPAAPPMASFQFFREPGGSRRPHGTFSLWGVAIEGDAKTTGTDCNSEDGCKPVSIDDETSDEISLDVVLETDSVLNERDTAYTDQAGIRISEEAHRSIRFEDGVFSIELQVLERKIQVGEGSVANISYTSTLDTRGSFTISPLDKAPSSILPRPGAKTGDFRLRSRAILEGDRWTVAFQAPTDGRIQVRLVDPDGRILSQGTRTIRAGSGREVFPLETALRRMAISEVVFVSRDGSATREIRRHPVVAAPPGH
ncbi:MAG TPA: Ig-like domain-containing protein [Fibrobacteria bacterium]|nr:Ig-like domain-containing protein [Fibrobacteria bacterium]HOX50422.1 Ig-like domain-containing protein [Fibrobacteria bacterium]